MARTGENIYKRKDGRWEARYIYMYDVKGKAKYRSVYGISRQEAKKKKELAIHEHMSGISVDSSPNAVFKDIAHNWLINTKLRVKESTFARYKNQVDKHVLPFFGKYTALKISTELIEKFVSRLLTSEKNNKKEGFAPKTVEDILIIVKSILRFGKCYAHLELNRIKIKQEDKRPCTLSTQAQRHLHSFLRNNTNFVMAGILLSLNTGIRIGELCALDWDNIDLEKGILRIEKTLQRIQIVDEGSSQKTKIVITAPKSKRSIREIPIPKSLTAILRNIKNNSKGFLLTGCVKYMEPRTLHNHFKNILKQCTTKDDYKFHSLRHTFATNYIELGGDAQSLSELLGHSSVKITLEKYVNPSSELKRNNVEKLAAKYNYSPSEMPSEQYVGA